MSLVYLARRLAVLEAQQWAVVPEAQSGRPAITEEYIQELLRILHQHGLFATIPDMLVQCFGLREDELDPAMVEEVREIVALLPEGEV